MKPNSLQNCRRNSSRLSPDHSVESFFKSPVAFFWIVLHGLCCVVSLILGFRFSRLIFLLIFSVSGNSPDAGAYRWGSKFVGIQHLNNEYADSSRVPDPDPSSASVRSLNESALGLGLGSKSSRVHVGRHGILIRPWPHPDPVEVVKAHKLLERVQQEQRKIYGVKDWRTVIVITPTYVRTFQSVHLTGLMHTLMLVPGKVVWIVVEAGGVSNETSRLVSSSGVEVIHVGFGQRMPVSWEGRHRMEARMRIEGLRIVRERMLDGIVMFADDSNTHSLELFDEIQSVKWFASLSVGILAQPGNSEISQMDEQGQRKTNLNDDKDGNIPLPVQGPACNSSGNLVGWHTFNSIPYAQQSARFIDDASMVLPRRLEWAGFVLNSKIIWKNSEKPSWVRRWDEWIVDVNAVESPLSLLNDDSFVEPLGRCGRRILLWWLRVEARADSKFPPGWLIDPPLDIVVPAKHTPWPDPPPPAPVHLTTTDGNPTLTEKQVKSGKSSRSRRHKRKREARTEAQQVSQVSDRDGTN
eukprot:TRINITY_DN22984_c0_g1_i1.p1 TRINITY_DN22984_c0_g1~~TRINITY_DN22984_c0_g1_i1.p1  ORF type:complete len:524 (+),score=64.25 TRINITY_DN22984_c0_g1_i1:248-1819(+)